MSGQEQSTGNNPKETEEDAIVKQSFGKWLLDSKISFLFLFSLPIFPSILKVAIGKEEILTFLHNVTITKFIEITIAIQCVFILFAIFLPVNARVFSISNETNSQEGKTPEKKEDEDKEKKKIANKALQQFKNAWTLVWTAWFFLYATLFLKYHFFWPPLKFDDLIETFLSSFLFVKDLPFFEVFSSFFRLFSIPFFEKTEITPLLNLFNNFSTLALIICYLIFTRITVEGEKDDKKNGIRKKNILFWASTGFSVIVFYSTISFIYSYSVFDFLTSIAAGIAMAFFIGKLNNKLISPPKFVIVCLYFYMAIQTTYPFWGSYEMIVLITSNLAFLFKIIFYLYVLYLFRKGKIVYYFYRIRKIFEDMSKEMEK